MHRVGGRSRQALPPFGGCGVGYLRLAEQRTSRDQGDEEGMPGGVGHRPRDVGDHVRRGRRIGTVGGLKPMRHVLVDRLRSEYRSSSRSMMEPGPVQAERADEVRASAEEQPQALRWPGFHEGA